MEPIEITNEVPPTIPINTINIEGIEYLFTIKKDEKENEIIIILSEEKPNKNMTFIYKASTGKIIKDIKQLFICENIDEMIISLQNIFNKGKITVEKKDEKYILKIEIITYGKKLNY